jgi:hypothetical protein
MDETSDDGLPADIMVNASHQAGVDLDDVRPELNEMIEIGDARACVVDGKSDVESKGSDGVAKRAVRGCLVLGDLKPSGLARAPRSVPNLRRRRGSPADIDAEPGPTG